MRKEREKSGLSARIRFVKEILWIETYRSNLDFTVDGDWALFDGVQAKDGCR